MNSHDEPRSARDRFPVDVECHRMIGLNRRATNLPDGAAASPPHRAIEQPRHLTDRRHSRSLFEHDEIQDAVVHFRARRNQAPLPNCAELAMVTSTARTSTDSLSLVMRYVPGT